MSECAGFQLEEATIGHMQKALEEGQLTSIQLVNCYLKRTFQTRPYLKWVSSPSLRSHGSPSELQGNITHTHTFASHVESES